MRHFNFSSGPATLPEAVLETAKNELLNWQKSGMSIMEMSHRSEIFRQIAKDAEHNLRQLMSIPDNYQVLFLQGGATSQFSMVPINLLRSNNKADYINTGVWSTKAIKEAKKYCEVNVAYSSEADKFNHAPSQAQLNLSKDSAFVHYTPNETINGVAFDYIPETFNVPLVADMSSVILAEEFDVSKFGLIYAGAQKNIGPAGLTIVIVRQDLLGSAIATQPTMFDYQVHAKSGSMLNTPPTFAWYLAGLVFKWLQQQGGVRKMAESNKIKAQKLYSTIDASNFYQNNIVLNNRSVMNVPFTLNDETQNQKFLNFAESKGLLNLKGHRSFGGMRASIYNAMPETGVNLLVETMQQFGHND